MKASTPTIAPAAERHGLAGEPTAAEGGERAEGREREAAGVGGERAAHRENRQSDDGNGNELKTLDPARARDVRVADDERQRRHRQRGREREPDPRREPAEAAGTARPDRDPELARRRSGQEARERDELGEVALVEPGATLDVLGPEVPDVRDGPAERGDAEAPRHPQHLEGRSRWPGRR